MIQRFLVYIEGSVFGMDQNFYINVNARFFVLE